MPQRGLRFTDIGAFIADSTFVGVVNFDILDDFAMAMGFDDDAVDMITMHPEKNIREKRNIFRRRVPFFRQILKLPKPTPLSSRGGL